jgi:hypothetical protein
MGSARCPLPRSTLWCRYAKQLPLRSGSHTLHFQSVGRRSLARLGGWMRTGLPLHHHTVGDATLHVGLPPQVIPLVVGVMLAPAIYLAIRNVLPGLTIGPTKNQPAEPVPPYLHVEAARTIRKREAIGVLVAPGSI